MNRNKLGPNNKGPKTGRQLGNCKGANPKAGDGRRPRRRAA